MDGGKHAGRGGAGLPLTGYTSCGQEGEIKEGGQKRKRLQLPESAGPDPDGPFGRCT